MRDVFASQDVLPDALRQLVSAVGGAAAKTGHRLEKETPARAPQALFFARIDDFGMGYMFEQHLLSSLRNAQRLELHGVAEQCEPPLVGIERMGLRVWCQYYRTI